MKYLIALLMLMTASLFSGGLLTHALTAQKFLEIHPLSSEQERNAFLQGTLFPDINYLGKIDRDKTHFESVTIRDVLEAKTPFYAGMLFHSWVDEKRAAWMQAQPLVVLPGDIPTEKSNFFQKFLEDEILYSHLNKEQILFAVDQLEAETLSYVEREQAELWVDLMGQYFTFRPYSIIKMVSVMKDVDLFNIPHALLRAWARAILHLRNQPQVREEVEQMFLFLQESMLEEEV